MKSSLANTANIKVFAILSMVLTLAACGNNPGAVRLPDEQSLASEGDSGLANEVDGVIPAADPADIAAVQEPVSEDATVQANALSNYNFVDPTHMISDKHLKAALLYYDANKSKIKNTSYLSVIDFGLSSTKKRFFIINMKTGSVWAIHTAHGKNSDPGHDGYAEKFSNVSGSNMSSLGVYKTAETYSGNHGLSLRLDGMSSTNSKARSRAIVVHGASYVQEASVIQGRSFGCPAVAMENRDKVISLIKGGSIIYAGYK